MNYKKIMIFVPIVFFIYYFYVLLFALYSSYQRERFLILYSVEKLPIFQHKVKSEKEFIFINYRKISYRLFPIRIAKFHQYHSDILKAIFPEKIIRNISNSFIYSYEQFYPGFYFLKCHSFFKDRSYCNPNSNRVINTEISKSLQDEVLKIIKTELLSLKHLGAQIGSVVILEKGKTYNHLRVIINNSYRPYVDTFTKVRLAGSTLKPFLYALAFEKLGYGPLTIIEDLPKEYRNPFSLQIYIPKNYDNRYLGMITIREALGNSRNVPAVEILNRLGIQTFYEFFLSAGIKHLKPIENYGLSFALGSGGISQIQLSLLYSILANEGILKPLLVGYYQDHPLFLTMDHRIINAELQPKRFFQRETIRNILSILSDQEIRRISFGKRNFMDFPFPIFAKTGTSYHFRDSWIVGFTERYIISVWVGRVSGEPMYGISGIKGAGKIFYQIVKLLKPHISIRDRDIFSLKGNYKKKWQYNQKSYLISHPYQCKIFYPLENQSFYVEPINRNYQRVLIQVRCFLTFNVDSNKVQLSISRNGKKIYNQNIPIPVKNQIINKEFFLIPEKKGTYQIQISLQNQVLDQLSFFVQ